MLHITNGESAAGSLRQSGLQGQVQAWQDVLHEGPVPAGLLLDELRPVRAHFLADTFHTSYDTILAELTARDAMLVGYADHDEVVLWFEHDLYDQLQLLQILDWLAGRAPGATRLSLLCIGAHPEVHPFHGLGQLSPMQLAALFPARQSVTVAHLALARAAWSAFRAPDPTSIETLLGGDTSALPNVEGALTRHLEQFPAASDGLSRSERQILQSVAAGTARPGQLFQESIKQEDRPFLGDTVFWSYVAGLTQGEQPLLAVVGGGRFIVPEDWSDGRAREVFHTQELELTEAGRAVWAGGMDWISLRGGIDRWLGGVHLSGPEASWRWNRQARRLGSNGRSTPAASTS